MILPHTSQCSICRSNLKAIKQHQEIIRCNLIEALRNHAPYLMVAYGQVVNDKLDIKIVAGGEILKFESLNEDMVTKFRIMLTRLKRDETIVLIETPDNKHVGLYKFPLNRPIKRIR